MSRPLSAKCFLRRHGRLTSESIFQFDYLINQLKIPKFFRGLWTWEAIPPSNLSPVFDFTFPSFKRAKYKLSTSCFMPLLSAFSASYFRSYSSYAWTSSFSYSSSKVDLLKFLNFSLRNDSCGSSSSFSNKALKSWGRLNVWVLFWASISASALSILMIWFWCLSLSLSSSTFWRLSSARILSELSEMSPAPWIGLP